LTSEWGANEFCLKVFHSLVPIRLSFLVQGPKARPLLWMSKFSLNRRFTARFWTAPAERSGDGAFGRVEVVQVTDSLGACQSGVALRLEDAPVLWSFGRV
jgi:hypothetical protein